MLISAEHEILNAHKYKNIRKFSFFSRSNKCIMLFFQLIKVEMPTFDGISSFMSRNNFMFSIAAFVGGNVNPILITAVLPKNLKMVSFRSGSKES